MQLNDKKNKRGIGMALSAATCSLLMGTTSGHAEAAAEGPWRLDVGAMSYNEEKRIDVQSVEFDARRRVGEDEFVSVKGTYDSVTGASPTGATYIQTNTSASGSVPIASFSVTRKALSGVWERPVTNLTRMNVGLSQSRSLTYNSGGGSLVMSTDFNQRNTTLTYGVGYGRDSSEPVNGIPDPLSAVGSDNVIGSAAIKRQTDLQLGVTQVLGRATLAQLNFVRSYAGGYLSSPYKVVSVVHPLTGETLNYDALHEKRPDERLSNALLGQVNHHFGPGTAYVTYRYYWDDWGIQAHTLDIKYRHPLSQKVYLQPNVRGYTQSAADFYRPVVLSNEIPEYVSADHRLNELQTLSYGLKVGYRTDGWGELTARYEYIRQTGDEHPAGTVGVQRDAKLFPDLTVYVMHVGYTVNF